MDGSGDKWVGAMMAREQKRTTGHVNSSAHTQDVHMKHKGGSTLRDKALWVMGLISEANAYPILTLVCWQPKSVTVFSDPCCPRMLQQDRYQMTGYQVNEEKLAVQAQVE